ncbi:hypothetical protein PR048_001845 [Dryococelus australis]|uniref:Uncharacterized protein n=1 Tax=Dryococelus australis TaxID=614101 RepID=A0ABQ9IIN6_9NEOP|nr:hypothetical protein PR048_001845 [Dryococelus australis]
MFHGRIHVRSLSNPPQDIAEHFATTSFCRDAELKFPIARLEATRCGPASQLPAEPRVSHARENPLTSGVVRDDSHMQKSGGDLAGNRTQFTWWDASSLTTTSPRPLLVPRASCLSTSLSDLLREDYLSESRTPPLPPGNRQCATRQVCVGVTRQSARVRGAPASQQGTLRHFCAQFTVNILYQRSLNTQRHNDRVVPLMWACLFSELGARGSGNRHYVWLATAASQSACAGCKKGGSTVQPSLEGARVVPPPPPPKSRVVCRHGDGRSAANKKRHPAAEELSLVSASQHERTILRSAASLRYYSLDINTAPGNSAGLCRMSTCFLWDLSFTPFLHFGAAPYSPQFAPVGSQDLNVKSPPNFSILAKDYPESRTSAGRVKMAPEVPAPPPHLPNLARLQPWAACEYQKAVTPYHLCPSETARVQDAKHPLPPPPSRVCEALGVIHPSAHNRHFSQLTQDGDNCLLVLRLGAACRHPLPTIPQNRPESRMTATPSPSRLWPFLILHLSPAEPARVQRNMPLSMRPSRP